VFPAIQNLEKTVLSKMYPFLKTNGTGKLRKNYVIKSTMALQQGTLAVAQEALKGEHFSL